MTDTVQDLRYAIRGLARAPVLAAAVALTLAVGIGGTTAVFSVLNGVVIKPLSYREPDALVGVWHRAAGVGLTGDANLSATQYYTYREHNRTFEEIGIWSSDV